MRIQVIYLLPSAQNEAAPAVAFSGACGRAWGRWRGLEMPEVGAFADVEVEIPDGVTSWAVADGPAVVASDAPEAPVRVRGVVEAVAEESVIAIRVGADIVLVEVVDAATSLLSGHAGKPWVGDSIEFTTPRIEVHPYFV